LAVTPGERHKAARVGVGEKKTKLNLEQKLRTGSMEIEIPGRWDEWEKSVKLRVLSRRNVDKKTEKTKEEKQRSGGPGGSKAQISQAKGGCEEIEKNENKSMSGRRLVETWKGGPGSGKASREGRKWSWGEGMSPYLPWGKKKTSRKQEIDRAECEE